MLRILAGALALVLMILIPQSPAHAAGVPLVTGRCGCAIGGGLFIAKCNRKDGVCTRSECAKACQEAMPKKTSTRIEPITDVSAARRIHGGRSHDRHAGL